MDGTVDCLDGCPLDGSKTSPGFCGCGVPEAQNRIDSDSDGVGNCQDQCPTDPAKYLVGVCGCFVPETDTDRDGTPDCRDGCPTDPAKTAPGQCDCFVSDLDSDRDGTADCNDACPFSPIKIEPGVCGCNRPDVDSDRDGTLDCNDECPRDPTTIVKPCQRIQITVNTGGSNSSAPTGTPSDPNAGSDIPLDIGFTLDDEVPDVSLEFSTENDLGFDSLVVRIGPIEEITPEHEFVKGFGVPDVPWDLMVDSTDYYDVVNYTSLVFFSQLNKRQTDPVDEIPLQVKFSQWVIGQTLNFRSHGARKYVLPGDIKSGIELTDWPFEATNNSLRLVIQYESAEGLVPEDSDPCDDDDETQRGTVPLDARVFPDSENIKRFDMNSGSGLELRIGLAVVAVLDGRVRDIGYEAYSNGTVYLYFPYFESTLGYDPSLAALFGDTDCQTGDNLLGYILPLSFMAGLFALSVLCILVILYVPIVKRWFFGQEGIRVETLRSLSHSKKSHVSQVDSVGASV